jgi:hypothetical protein
MAVAEPGMVQSPFVPVTWNVTVWFAPIGVERVPTVSGAGRVSSSRHAVIGTSTLEVPVPVAPIATAPRSAPPARIIVSAIACGLRRRIIGAPAGSVGSGALRGPNRTRSVRGEE